MTALIHIQMAKIMAEVEPVAKGRRNTTQGYSFRGVDDVYQALQAIMAKHGVYSLPNVIEERTEDRQSAKGGVLIYRVLKIRYDFYAADGSTVSATVIGEGMDSGDKASNKAMSVADKYCLLQAYKIPTEEPKDPENDSPEPVKRSDPPRLTYQNEPHAEPGVELYDWKNKEHNVMLIEKLKKMGVDPRDFTAIGKLMHGKPRNEGALNAVLSSVRRKMEPVTQEAPPPPDDDYVPFMRRTDEA